VRVGLFDGLMDPSVQLVKQVNDRSILSLAPPRLTLSSLSNMKVLKRVHITGYNRLENIRLERGVVAAIAVDATSRDLLLFSLHGRYTDSLRLRDFTLNGRICYDAGWIYVCSEQTVYKICLDSVIKRFAGEINEPKAVIMAEGKYIDDICIDDHKLYVLGMDRESGRNLTVEVWEGKTRSTIVMNDDLQFGTEGKASIEKHLGRIMVWYFHRVRARGIQLSLSLFPPTSSPLSLNWLEDPNSSLHFAELKSSPPLLACVSPMGRIFVLGIEQNRLYPVASVAPQWNMRVLCVMNSGQVIFEAERAQISLSKMHFNLY